MSTEKRTIKINPELFKVSEKNTSRKKKPASGLKIKMKSELKTPRNKTLRRSVMKMIREKQMEEYKKLFEESSTKGKENPSQKSELKSEFNKDFNSSLDFFGSLVEKEKQENKHNSSIKRYPNENVESLIFHPISENVSMEFPEVSNEIVPVAHSSIPIQKPRMQFPPPPQFGCMKYGNLPTKRSWMNATRRNNGTHGLHKEAMQTAQIMNSTYSAPTLFTESSQIIKPPVSEIKKDLSEKRQKFEKGILVKNPKNKLKYLKRRKIYKRTFKIGRSKIAPKIAVLVSNRTIRNRISTEAQLLKQTPIQDVKKYLIKKGFIKVGTIAPNDVLRKMYETIHTICGEIDNHNPENLLFNFIHDSNK
jgi:hypothetical protein